MGLIKNLEMPTGVIVTYWEMAAMEITVNFRRTLINQIIDFNMIPIPIGMDEDNKVVNVYLYGYLTKEARDNGKLPLTSDIVSFPLPETINTVEDLRPLFYELIKQNENWSDAVDA